MIVVVADLIRPTGFFLNDDNTSSFSVSVIPGTDVVDQHSQYQEKETKSSLKSSRTRSLATLII